MLKDIHLTRFFCKYADRQKVVRVGEFIHVPDDEETFPKGKTTTFFKDKDDTVWPRSWDHYKEYRSIVLLGPPRHGKTSEFLFQSSRVESGFSLSLRNLLNPEEPETAFDHQTEYIKYAGDAAASRQIIMPWMCGAVLMQQDCGFPLGQKNGGVC
jgi:hypothetical protein